jgi:hypothetical protein
MNNDNELAKKNIKFPLKYDDYGRYIFDADGNIFAQIRGWGKLQKLENGAEVQDAIGQFVVQTLNAAVRNR